MEGCIFCKIVDGSMSTERLFETDLVLGFKDIRPQAPVHLLIVPKRHVEKPDELKPDELADLFEASRQLADKFNVRDSGYRLLFNVGRHAGQEMDHVHLHLIGGKRSKSIY